MQNWKKDCKTGRWRVHPEKIFVFICNHRICETCFLKRRQTAEALVESKKVKKMSCNKSPKITVGGGIATAGNSPVFFGIAMPSVQERSLLNDINPEPGTIKRCSQFVFFRILTLHIPLPPSPSLHETHPCSTRSLQLPLSRAVQPRLIK